eukprot:3096958-Alexandrium_andersonii.AAC.1
MLEGTKTMQAQRLSRCLFRPKGTRDGYGPRATSRPRGAKPMVLDRQKGEAARVAMHPSNPMGLPHLLI